MPKSLDERMVEEERNETLYKAVGSLPEIQRRRFLLYYEYEFNFYQIAAMEHCTASAIQKSVAIAKEKVKAEIEEISPTVTDTARNRNLFFICVGLAALHTLTFFRGSKSIFKEVNAYVQRKQRHRPKGGKPCRSYRQSTPKRSFIPRRDRLFWDGRIPVTVLRNPLILQSFEKYPGEGLFLECFHHHRYLWSWF